MYGYMDAAAGVDMTVNASKATQTFTFPVPRLGQTMPLLDTSFACIVTLSALGVAGCGVQVRDP
jgi:hypothetical protein